MDIKRTKASSAVLTAVFIAFLAVFGAGGRLRSEDREFSEMENRNLAQKPELSAKAVFSEDPSYMERTEDYMADQIVFKDGLMSLKTTCDYFSGHILQNGVYFGSGSNGEVVLLQRYTEDSANIAKNVSCINDFADSLNIPADLMLVPNSICINADKLPSGAVTDDQRETMAAVRGMLSESVSLYDPTERLEELNKTTAPAYYRTDHHWTASAARTALDGWLESAGYTGTMGNYNYVTVNNFYGTLYSKAPAGFITPDTFGYYENPSAGYEVKNLTDNSFTYSVMDVSYLEKKDKYASYLGGNFALLKITSTVTEGKSGEKILVLKDSYANSLLPLLSEKFSEVYAVDLRYFHTGAVSELIDQYGIDRVLLVYNVDFLNEDRNFVWLS